MARGHDRDNRRGRWPVDLSQLSGPTRALHKPRVRRPTSLRLSRSRSPLGIDLERYRETKNKVSKLTDRDTSFTDS